MLSPNIISSISLEGYVLVLDKERVNKQASCGMHTFSIHSSLVGTQCLSPPSCSVLSKARAQEVLISKPSFFSTYSCASPWPLDSVLQEFRCLFGIDNIKMCFMPVLLQ